MLYLVSYDVVDDDQRRRIHDCLKDYGRRVQFSVFECKLGDDEMAELWGKLLREVDLTRDSIRRYRRGQLASGAPNRGGEDRQHGRGGGQLPHELSR